MTDIQKDPPPCPFCGCAIVHSPPGDIYMHSEPNNGCILCGAVARKEGWRQTHAAHLESGGVPLTEDDIKELAASKMDAKHNHLNAELEGDTEDEFVVERNGPMRGRRFKTVSGVRKKSSAAPCGVLMRRAAITNAKEWIRQLHKMCDDKSVIGYLSGMPSDIWFADWIQHIQADALNSVGQIPSDGWQLVPKEPTSDMIDAAITEFVGNVDADATYNAMLEAAPPAPTYFPIPNLQNDKCLMCGGKHGGLQCPQMTPKSTAPLGRKDGGE